MLYNYWCFEKIQDIKIYRCVNSAIDRYEIVLFLFCVKPLFDIVKKRGPVILNLGIYLFIFYLFIYVLFFLFIYLTFENHFNKFILTLNTFCHSTSSSWNVCDLVCCMLFSSTI